MTWLFFIITMAILCRLSGNGFGSKWGVSQLPEVLFSLPFGIAASYAVSLFASFPWVIGTFFVGSIWSYAWMQSGTWPILPWDIEGQRNTERSSTLKPFVDWVAKKLNIEFDSEAYAWLYAATKGFLIGLPVGGIPLAILWPLGYEIGSHARGRVERFGIEPFAISEGAAGAGAGIAICVFISIIKLFVG